MFENRHGQKRMATEHRSSNVGHNNNHHRHHQHDLDDDPKPAIQSSVLPISKNIKTREDLIKLQTKFNGSEQRNRRMIGLLVGTLKEFKSDDKERSSTKQVSIFRKLFYAYFEICSNNTSTKLFPGT